MSETIEDILRDMRKKRCIAWVGTALLAYSCRIEAATKELRDENAKLKAALKPVLEVTPTAWTTTNRFNLGEFQTPVYDGKWCEAAVLDSQRIYKEGASK